MRQAPIRFFHRQQIVEVRGVAPTTSVLTWLREHARCTGSKEGCAEGDCGACTVMVGDLQDDGQLRLRAVNSCIQFLPTLDGKALITIEDLPSLSGQASLKGVQPVRHPAQQALVDCHGSQCGFCTPGFAMTLAALYERTHEASDTAPTRQAINDELSGNLCRCTGYRPIVDAGQAMFELPAQRMDRGPTLAALHHLRSGQGLHYQSEHGSFWAPRSLDELAALSMQHPQAKILAGGTDVALWVNKQFKRLGDIIYVGQVSELCQITKDADTLTIGATASLEQAWAALVAEVPSLRELWLRFAGLPIRNAGTLGGNIANGSPIGDGAPALMALGASIVLRKGSRTRSLMLQDFYLDYMKNQLESGEFVQALTVPLPDASWVVRGYKISKRYDCDISAVCAGLALQLNASGEVVGSRFAFGGMAATVKRATRLEAALAGKPWAERTIEDAIPLLEQDFTPLSDMRASASYRMRVAQNLLRRFWLETRLDAPLSSAQTTVWRQG